MIGADLFAWLVETSIALALITGLVLLVRKPVSRHIGPNAAYALWLLPLIRLFLPDLALLPAVEPGEGPVNGVSIDYVEPNLALAPTGQETSLRYRDSGAIIKDQDPAPSKPAPTDNLYRDRSYMEVPAPEASGIVATLSSMAQQARPSFSALSPTVFITAGFVVWLGVACLWLTAMFCRQGLLHRSLRRASRPADNTLGTQVEAICADLQIRRTIRVRVCKQRVHSDNPRGEVSDVPVVMGPLVMGLVRPTIILPARFDALYTANEQHMTLLHECMHVRRGDLWVTLAALCFRALNWHNPLVHAAWRSFRADQEAACDASVLRTLSQPIPAANKTAGTKQAGQYQARIPGGLVDYGSALIKSARLAADHMASVRALPTPSLIHQHSSTQVKERLMLIKTSGDRNRFLEAGVALAALAVGLGLTANYTHAAQLTPEKSQPVSEAAKKDKKPTPETDKQESFSVYIDNDDDIISINGNTLTKEELNDVLAALEDMDFSGFADRFNDLDLDLDLDLDGIEDAIELAGDRFAFAFGAEIEDLIGNSITEDNIIRMVTGGDNRLSFYINDQQADKSKIAKPFKFKRTNDEIILRTGDSENLRVERDGENLIVNGKAVDLNQCQEENGRKASLILRVDDGQDGAVEVICQKTTKPLFANRHGSNQGAFAQSMVLKNRLQAMEKDAERQAANEQRSLERTRERANEMVERAKDRAKEMVERAERAARDAQIRQRRAATERQREISRLRRELERLEAEEETTPTRLAPRPAPAPLPEPAPSAEPGPTIEPAPVPPVPAQ